MNIVIEFHGALRQLAGTELPVTLASRATVAEALKQLAERFPAAAPRLAQTACAIGDTLVARDCALREGQRLALIPPVSGG